MKKIKAYLRLYKEPVEIAMGMIMFIALAAMMYFLLWLDEAYYIATHY